MSNPVTTEPLTTRWSSPRPEDRFAVDNPATGTSLATVAGCDADGVHQAVTAAHAAFSGWRALLPRERAEYLRRIAGLLAEHSAELAELECAEVGKPVAQAALDVAAAVSIFAMFADFAADPPSATRSAGHVVDLTTLVPYGVVGAIIPFNWPPIHTAGKTAPALAAGNTVVLKPPEQAPLTVMRIIELMQQVLPDGVVHAIPGGAPVGAALAGHRLVRKLSFTGAPATGTAVIRTAAGNLTPTLMELGGKNALIVFADADQDAALAAAISGGFYNQGEACTAASRLLLHRDIHDEFLARLGPAVRRLRVGEGADPETHVGPLVTAAQQRRVLDYLDVAAAEGAVVAAQAPLPTAPDLARGFWAPPTLLSGVTPQMRVAQEEIFGPVVVALAFDDEADAVRIANGTDFGLVASVFTQDIARAMRVSDQLDVGAVFINNYDRALSGSPFGGTKRSGYGREHTPDTLSEFGYTRTVRLPSGLRPLPQWPAVADVLPPAPVAAEPVDTRQGQPRSAPQTTDRTTI